ncbi:protein disulfide-isomerase precursor [Coemansia sp. RSA 989]|nr:thioredoxin-like domain-containing protein [Coemansia mojavensis]KAJ1740729.1 protein disulfide-isomerase precursor [Coemansia sp. RSA 1086]KAJ1750825.1 protein disulfide-isomerase precursor [Coemansia sp. RSA 1821]KAJ1863214.1 protein disulfide-isomerase precursor [Coemansia sp. RSA 989]KAJ1872758.1 protein disulfide-isomerase precursor [Coemansia sp. RSA 990]KAJ2669626.1 protein disulfide-isomerase precursor [Coemansia sp. RSA 1085]
MRISRQLAAALVVGLRASAVSAAEPAAFALTDATFDAWSDSQSLALVKFFAPWCVYCQALALPYEKAAAALKKDGIPLAKVDCTKEQKLCDDMEITGYPTLKVVVDGDYYAYNGTRDESGIVSYMRRHQQPAVTDLSQSSLAQFTQASGVAAVGFFERSAPEFAVFEAAAQELRDEFSFGVVKDKAVAKSQNVPVPGVAVYTNEGSMDIFTGSLTTDNLVKFVRMSSVPLLGELSSQTFGTYVHTQMPIGLAFYSGNKMRAELKELLKDIAREFRLSVSVALVDAQRYSKHAKLLGLEPRWPAFAVQDVAKRTKYLFSQLQELSAPELRRFIGSIADGRRMPDYRSQPIPAANDGAIFELVSKQFNEVAFDSTKDVLVQFYSPWCIHCKNMAPAYEELARSLHDHRNLVVARMDATANDVPSADPALNVQGYPTVVLIRANDNRIVEYRGNRSVQSMTDFLRQNAAHPPIAAAISSAAAEASPATGSANAVPDRPLGFTPKETRHIEL